jgi:prophage antirepressor-like protein
MNQLTKVTSNIFNDVHVDFFKNDEGDIIMTAEQIGNALGYTHPRQSIINIFNRNKDRLEKFSVETNLISTDGKEYETRIFNEKGIYAIIMLSNKPKAIEFQEWVYDVISDIRKNGFFLPTTIEQPELLEKINQLETKIESFVTLNSHEARTLQKSINRRVYELADEIEHRTRLFAEIHREIRDRFGVPSYRDVAKLDLTNVLNYVKAWMPKRVA